MGITPSSASTKQVDADVQAGDLASAVAQDAANGTQNGATVLDEKEELIEKDIRDKFKRMCEGYYDNVAKKLLKEHNVSGLTAGVQTSLIWIFSAYKIKTGAIMKLTSNRVKYSRIGSRHTRR